MKCSQCGEVHGVDEMELTFQRPDIAAQLTPEQRAQRVQENSDLCVLDGERFFVRAVFPLPVESSERSYNIGLWVEVPQLAFKRIYELWDDPNQHLEAPFEARIANDIPTQPESLGLAANLHLTDHKTRPSVFLREASHSLFFEQTSGISKHRAHEYSTVFA